MLAARIHRHGAPDVLQIDDIPVPGIGSGDLLIRVLATSVNHRDIWIRKGHPHPAYRVDLPTALGVDVCGVVEKTGAAVTSFKPGDRIVANPYMPCGKCDYCQEGSFQYCPCFSVYNGSYAQYSVIPSAIAVVIAPEVPIHAAAAFPNSYITAWQMLVDKAQMTPADTVFVWAGTSGLGSAAVDIARLTGARVIASAGSARKLDMLKTYGADLVVDHHDSAMVSQVMAFTRGKGATIVFEHVGKATWGRSVEMCSSGGTIVTAGATSGDEVSMDVTYAFVKQIRILGSRLGTMKDARQSVHHLNQGRFKPRIGEILPLAEIAHAHALMEKGEIVGKIIIDLQAN